jgi:hypothetical protein
MMSTKIRPILNGSLMIENKGFSIKTTELVDVLGWFHRLRYNSVSLVWALTSYSRKA